MATRVVAETASRLGDLWHQCQNEGDERAREQLAVKYFPLVQSVAKRVAQKLPGHIDESDLISYGLVGLVNAIERFDPKREIKFETFATTRIRGAIIDELRALDWVPRSLRTKMRNIERAQMQLENRLQRTPTDSEIAREMKISIDELRTTLSQIGMSSVVTLDEPQRFSDGRREPLRDRISDCKASDPAATVNLRERALFLQEAIRLLPEREKTVVALYFYRDLSLREIGEQMHVTESRISQLRTRAMDSLKITLQGTI